MRRCSLAGRSSRSSSARTRAVGQPSGSWFPLNGWVPSASSGLPFLVTASSLRNQKAGLVFYGFGAQAVPFQGGTMCVAAPTRRTPVQVSGGSALPANDCTGSFALDFNAWIQSAVDPALGAGADVDAQHWSRDPGAAANTGLSDAIHFRIRP